MSRLFSIAKNAKRAKESEMNASFQCPWIADRIKADHGAPENSFHSTSSVVFSDQFFAPSIWIVGQFWHS
ncbi:MAG TPA: hypothetical protein VJN64_08250 [Terriglobales bacterium]|nr:hypothetical protein [Terriglobales bacterium]